MTTAAKIQSKFATDFTQSWRTAKAELTACGIHYGATVRNKDGWYFRITLIQPKVYNFGEPKAGFTCYGVKYRADGTWGAHKHWVGDVGDLTVAE